jgi:LacI family transcriptional regulator
MATIKDIAKRAGVSTCTVSKILSGGRDHQRYSAACRERVQAAADSLGFVPNRVAHALRTGSTGIIGFAIEWPSLGTGNGFQAAMIAACEAAARRQGLHLLVIGPRGSDSALTSALHLLTQNQCDGVIIPGGHHSPAQLAQLKPHRAQIAFLGQVPAGFLGGELDDGAGVTAAVDHLIAHHHRHIAWIETAGCDRLALRYEAFSRACNHHHVSALRIGLPAYPAESDDEQRVAHVRDALIAQQHAIATCSAMVCYHDLTAIGAYAALAHLGRAVGHEVAVIGFDNVHAATAIPALTTVDHELPALAEAALTSLQGMQELTHIAPRLIIRPSSQFTATN